MNDPKEIVGSIVRQWTDWADETGMKKAVLGMSGGCDSYVAAKLATLVFGKENVIGVMMPNQEQLDISDAQNACKELGIVTETINIGDAYASFGSQAKGTVKSFINLAPRLRMCALYFIAQAEENAHVIATSNRSEIAVGYTTLWGDSVGDYAPLADITKTTVRAVGIHLGLNPELVNKVPADGLSGNSDEHALGFTYEELDTWLDRGITGPNIRKIASRINNAEFKRNLLKNIPRPIIGED
jgi:NAD+ synthase